MTVLEQQTASATRVKPRPGDHVYAMDIETDTDGVNGLDPREARITELVICGPREAVVFDDEDETTLLVRADNYLRRLRPGLISTWNGTFFDLPFIFDRARMLYNAGHSEIGDLGMTLLPVPGLTPKYDYLPGHTVGYDCLWRGRGNGVFDLHRHLDISFAYKGFADEHGIRHSLKPVAQAHGIEMIEVDRCRMHDLTPQERHDYVVSDGRGTRALTLHRLGYASLDVPNSANARA